MCTSIRKTETDHGCPYGSDFESTLYGIISAILEVDDVSPGMTVEDISSWDSLRHIQLISEIEKKFQVRFEFLEMAEMTSVQVIRDALAGKITIKG